MTYASILVSCIVCDESCAVWTDILQRVSITALSWTEFRLKAFIYLFILFSSFFLFSCLLSVCLHFILSVVHILFLPLFPSLLFVLFPSTCLPLPSYSVPFFLSVNLVFFFMLLLFLPLVYFLFSPYVAHFFGVPSSFIFSSLLLFFSFLFCLTIYPLAHSFVYWYFLPIYSAASFIIYWLNIPWNCKLTELHCSQNLHYDHAFWASAPFSLLTACRPCCADSSCHIDINLFESGA
jgi:hypothetical protein